MEQLVRIHGTRPLLHNNPAVMYVKAPPKKRGEQISPADDAVGRVYRLPDGTCYVPTEHFRSCFIRAGSDFKMAKYRTAKRPLTVALELEPGEHVPLLDGRDKPITEYRVDARRVMIQKAGIIRGRPAFDDWHCELKLVIDDRIWPEDQHALLLEILEHAGQTVGIGDFRPRFGRFTVEAVT